MAEQSPKDTNVQSLKVNRVTFRNQVILEDFNSKNLKVKRVPQTASQTCMGQRLIRPVIEPIPFEQKHQRMQQLSKATIKAFGLTQEDLDQTNGIVHKYNHVQQNIKLAGKFAIVKNLQQTFKKTVLAKNNAQNLVLIQNSNDEKQEVKRQQLIRY